MLEYVNVCVHGALQLTGSPSREYSLVHSLDWLQIHCNLIQEVVTEGERMNDFNYFLLLAGKL